jgi:DNA-binding response OmpR family regulator
VTAPGDVPDAQRADADVSGGETAGAPTPAPVPSGAGGPRRVLVVEDSATQAAALAALLEEHGYETIVARDGATALDRVADSSLDLVLSDVVMPGLSGYEVCRRIKRELGRRDLPVVLLTGLSDPMDIIRGLESGADNYITKPYERQHLLARVRQVLDNREVRRRPREGGGVEITFLGARFEIMADKEQILDLLVSSYEELVRTNQAVRQAEQRSRFLAEASGVLASSLDPDAVLGGLARFAVPALGEVCVADLVDEEGGVHRVEVAAATPAFAAAAAALREHPPASVGSGLVAHVLQQRAPVLLPELSDAAVRALPGCARCSWCRSSRATTRSARSPSSAARHAPTSAPTSSRWRRSWHGRPRSRWTTRGSTTPRSRPRAPATTCSRSSRTTCAIRSTPSTWRPASCSTCCPRRARVTRRRHWRVGRSMWCAAPHSARTRSSATCST